MADNDSGKNRGPGRDSVSSKRGAEEQPFDRWLQKQLHAMYDEIASEPLPDDLLELIQRDAAKAVSPDDSDPNGPPRKT